MVSSFSPGDLEDILVFLLGLALICVAFIFMFRKEALAAAVALPIVFLGAACCLVAAGFIPHLTAGGAEVDIKRAADDFTKQIADLSQTVESLKKQVDLQQTVNNSFKDTLGSINKESKANIDLPKIPDVSINANSNNSNYTLFVVYRDPRADEASKLVNNLLKAGFKAASISSDLSEIPNNSQKAGSTEVVFTQASAPVSSEIADIVKSTLNISSTEMKKVSSLGKSDAQILLF